MTVLKGTTKLFSTVVIGKCTNFDEHLDASITGMFLVDSKDKSGFSVFKDIGIFIFD